MQWMHRCHTFIHFSAPVSYCLFKAISFINCSLYFMLKSADQHKACHVQSKQPHGGWDTVDFLVRKTYAYCITYIGFLVSIVVYFHLNYIHYYYLYLYVFIGTWSGSAQSMVCMYCWLSLATVYSSAMSRSAKWCQENKSKNWRWCIMELMPSSQCIMYREENTVCTVMSEWLLNTCG